LGKVKRLLEMDEEAWKLLKSYAAYINKIQGEAAEVIILERLSKLKEVLENV